GDNPGSGVRRRSGGEVLPAPGARGGGRHRGRRRDEHRRGGGREARELPHRRAAARPRAARRARARRSRRPDTRRLAGHGDLADLEHAALQPREGGRAAAGRGLDAEGGQARPAARRRARGDGCHHEL
ncbi:MAG: hypothetical protein AVDCRST_MAG67-3918, partial [uncultured Solirubrobacteraceae bacterium]